VAGLDLATLDSLIGDTSFHAAKAAQIRQIARQTEREHGGMPPCDESVVRGFRGVGPKCAHLALGIACGQQHISVDIHVHRVTNRWGYVRASTPERAMAALETRLPRRVPFGKHIWKRGGPSVTGAGCPERHPRVALPLPEERSDSDKGSCRAEVEPG
jgi:endonuclease III